MRGGLRLGGGFVGTLNCEIEFKSTCRNKYTDDGCDNYKNDYNVGEALGRFTIHWIKGSCLRMGLSRERLSAENRRVGVTRESEDFGESETSKNRILGRPEESECRNIRMSE